MEEYDEMESANSKLLAFYKSRLHHDEMIIHENWKPIKYPLIDTKNFYGKSIPSRVELHRLEEKIFTETLIGLCLSGGKVRIKRFNLWSWVKSLVNKYFKIICQEK